MSEVPLYGGFETPDGVSNTPSTRRSTTLPSGFNFKSDSSLFLMSEVSLYLDKIGDEGASLVLGIQPRVG